MTSNTFIHLANGSDIRGIAIDTDQMSANLTPEIVFQIGVSFVEWLSRKTEKDREELSIAIGFDGRISGDSLKKALKAAFTQNRVHVIDVGIATTPSMFMSTQFSSYDVDGAIEITASHLPKEYNGLKFFTKDGGLDHVDIRNILKNAESDAEIHLEIDKSYVKHQDLLSDYSAYLRQIIQDGVSDEQMKAKPFKGLRIVCDAGNGTGGFFAEQVLKPLGADIHGSQFLEVDGTFPNHIPNPDSKEAMASLKKAVTSHEADIGIIFDTDADRAAVMDRDGNSINRNNLIALAGAIVLKDSPGGIIVTNSPVSSHAINFIADLGGKVEPYISGYKNVINRSQELNQKGLNSPLAIETSGHAAFRENYFLDDGAYLIAKILIADANCRSNGRTFIDLIDNLDEPVETEEVRFILQADDYRAQGESIIKELSHFGQEIKDFSLVPENKEGVRFNVSKQYGEGWFLLRMSLHEPKLVLQMENDQDKKISVLKETLIPFFEQFD